MSELRDPPVGWLVGNELRQHRSENLGRHDVGLASGDTESPVRQRVVAVDRPFPFVIHDVQTRRRCSSAGSMTRASPESVIVHVITS